MIAPLPPGPFDVILADPPWRYVTFTPATVSSRAPENHYQTMRLADIRAMPVAASAAADCHLFMWTTAPFLEISLRVMRSWGFAYSSTAFVWVKMRAGYNADQISAFGPLDKDVALGLGHTTRKQSELCLLGRRGSPSRQSKAIHEVIMAPLREHSRKPDEARQRIEAYCGPTARRLELFARSPAAGWTVWGNETEKFAPRGGLRGEANRE